MNLTRFWKVAGLSRSDSIAAPRKKRMHREIVPSEIKRLYMLWVYVNNNFRGYGETKKGIACVLKGSLDKNVVGCGVKSPYRYKV